MRWVVIALAFACACGGSSQSPYSGHWTKFYLGGCQLNAFDVDASGNFGTSYPNCSGQSESVAGNVTSEGVVTAMVNGASSLSGTCTTTSFCSGGNFSMSR